MDLDGRRYIRDRLELSTLLLRSNQPEQGEVYVAQVTKAVNQVEIYRSESLTSLEACRPLESPRAVPVAIVLSPSSPFVAIR